MYLTTTALLLYSMVEGMLYLGLPELKGLCLLLGII
jgi:hypothetical protein